MRLIDKFTIWFFVITSVVLLAGGLIVFSRVQHEVDQEAIRRISSHLDNTAKQLEQGKSPDELESEYVKIEEMHPAQPVIKLNVYDTMAVFMPRMTALDRKLTVERSYRIGDKHYRISMYDFVAEPDEIADGVKKSLGWIFLILLGIVGLTNLIISKRILSPFDKTLKAIENFSLKKDSEIRLPPTHTKEFQQLHYFLKQMTGKAQADYRALKEFTENASHELQTPLSVIRGKLEMLLESPIDDQQGNQILSALSAIERLSKINHSLTLLNKLENQEFSVPETVDMSKQVESVLNELSELIEMKTIRLTTGIELNVRVLVHPSLAEILVMNLVSNAIRHNFHGGMIHIVLTAKCLTIENTGPPPEFPLEQVFERFKRTHNNMESVGLGLAIVKQICEVSHLTVHYSFKNSRHILKVTFPR